VAVIHLYDLYFKNGSLYPAQRLPRWTTGIERAVCVTWSHRFTLVPHGERRWTRLPARDVDGRFVTTMLGQRCRCGCVLGDHQPRFPHACVEHRECRRFDRAPTPPRRHRVRIDSLRGWRVVAQCPHCSKGSVVYLPASVSDGVLTLEGYCAACERSSRVDRRRNAPDLISPRPPRWIAPTLRPPEEPS
jgi:hypothetical protein